MFHLVSQMKVGGVAVPSRFPFRRRQPSARLVGAGLRFLGCSRSFVLRHRRLSRQPLRSQAFVINLELWLRLTVRYLLPRRQRMERLSRSFVRDLLLGGSRRFDHLVLPSCSAVDPGTISNIALPRWLGFPGALGSHSKPTDNIANKAVSPSIWAVSRLVAYPWATSISDSEICHLQSDGSKGVTETSSRRTVGAISTICA